MRKREEEEERGAGRERRREKKGKNFNCLSESSLISQTPENANAYWK